MKMLGAEVVPVKAGQKTLKGGGQRGHAGLGDQCSQHALHSRHRLRGASVSGDGAEFAKGIIGDEARRQILEKEEKRLPDLLIACVGGGSNAIGLFYPFLEDASVKPCSEWRPAARGSFRRNTRPVFKAARSAFCRARAPIFCRMNSAKSSPRTAFPPGSITPPWGRSTLGCAIKAAWNTATPPTTRHLNAFMKLARLEGIIPALESAHAVAASASSARSKMGQGPSGHHRESFRAGRQGRGAGGGEGEAGNAEVKYD
jgi:tryptophan synthase beta chain